MKDLSLGEFFGFGGYERQAEGYMSWQHLTFVTLLNLVMILVAVLLGRAHKNKEQEKKNKVLAVAAILMDGLELFKIILLSFRHEDPFYFVYMLPLFLCSIQLISLPMAAFCKGRLKEASLDFVMIFGMLGALMGTYLAGNNYGTYPVICFDNIVSGLTHCIAGFASLYIMVSGMVSMKKQNIGVTIGVLSGFCVAAYIANIFTDSNYMFLSRGDGTPYDLVYNFVGGSPLLYPLCVVGLFAIYITLFYYVYFVIQKRKTKKPVKV